MQSETRTGSSRRLRRSRAEWRGIIEDYELGDQDATAYCRERGLTPSVFAKWSRIYRTQSGKKNAPFIELSSRHAAALTRKSADTDWRVELDLGIKQRLNWTQLTLILEGLALEAVHQRHRYRHSLGRSAMIE